jgi:hypothetical protein
MAIWGFLGAGAQPAEVAFTGLDSLMVWPNQPIGVEVSWEDTASAAECFLTNLTNGDTVLRTLAVVDSATSSLTLPFGAGWTLGRGAVVDTVMQAFYGDVIAVTVSGVADTARVGSETATITVTPETLTVGSAVTLTVEDRDANITLSAPDTVTLAWSSALGSGSGLLHLAETSTSSGVFSANAPIACALDLDPPDGALLVLDADSLAFVVWDSLGSWTGWLPPMGGAVGFDHQVATVAASLSLAHVRYGELAFLPTGSDSLLVSLSEPDLAGIGQLPVSVAIHTPQGAVRDSTVLTPNEDAPGAFSGILRIGGASPDVLAADGDSVIVRYADRAGDEGSPKNIRSAALLGGRLVSGVITDTLWSPGPPILLSDPVTVPPGHRLRVQPGCIVAALPGRAVTWRVEGEAVLGAQSGDTVWVQSAASTARAGDWAGIQVTGSFVANRAAIRDAVTGVAVSEGGAADLEEVGLHGCGAWPAGEREAWRLARGRAGALGTIIRQATVRPGAISVDGGALTSSNTLISENDGAGVVLVGGSCDIANSVIEDNAMDGLLSIGGACHVEHTDVCRHEQGGIYAAECEVTLAQCSLDGNALQGLCASGCAVTMTACEIVGNRGGGFMARDGTSCGLRASLVTGNHLFGVDVAWDCSVAIDSCAVVGNGGSGLVIDYASTFTVSASALAFNRRYAASVGAWCVGDSLEAADCWWGTPTMALDSTGTNSALIWDGVDNPGRAVIRFQPWRTTPPPGPAPVELVPFGGEELSFISGGGGPGDTLRLELAPHDGAVARYASVAVASDTDTLVCVLLKDDPAPGAALLGLVALVSVEDQTAPDRLAVSASSRVTAWWTADSTVQASLTLPVHGHGPVPGTLRLEAHPNPFSSALVLTWSAPSTRADLRLYDLAGRLLWRRDGEAAVGTIVIDRSLVASMSNGAYVAILRAGDRRSSLRVVRVG